MFNKLQLQQIFSDEYLKVEIDEKIKFIYIEWFKHPESADFRRLFSKLADLTIAAQSKYWLSDARAVHYIDFSDQNWVLRDIAPLLLKTKLLKFARLTTQESMAQLDVVRVMSMVGQLTNLGITTKLEIFTEKEAALKWLFNDTAIR